MKNCWRTLEAIVLIVLSRWTIPVPNWKRVRNSRGGNTFQLSRVSLQEPIRFGNNRLSFFRAKQKTAK